MDREQFPKCPRCNDGRMSVSGDGSQWCDRCEVPRQPDHDSEWLDQPATVSVIGGFPVVQSICMGCGKTLLLENAWMTDGCPCNSVLGVNSMNETRWLLLMQLQQSQARELIDSIRATLLVNFGADSKHNRYGIALKDEGTTLQLLMQALTHLTSENESIKGELAHMRTTDAVQDRQALLENVTALEVLLKRVAAECRETFIDTDEMAPAWVSLLADIDARIDDDRESGPITQDFIRLHGGEGLHADDLYFGWGDDAGWALAWYEPGNTLSVYGQDILHDHEPTQADVLCLLRALKISFATGI